MSNCSILCIILPTSVIYYTEQYRKLILAYLFHSFRVRGARSVLVGINYMPWDRPITDFFEEIRHTLGWFDGVIHFHSFETEQSFVQYMSQVDLHFLTTIAELN